MGDPEARLYDPTLTANEISELQYAIFDKRTRGPLFIGGVFISYCREDAKFVEKLYARLTKEQATVWLDQRDTLAGPLQRQIDRAIRLNDTVVLVLSRASIESAWVENELDLAWRKEKEENRNVICPIALDDSWKTKLQPDESSRVLWLTLEKKNVLDFSKWRTKAFEPVYKNLVKGLRIYYPPPDRSPRIAADTGG